MSFLTTRHGERHQAVHAVDALVLGDLPAVRWVDHDHGVGDVPGQDLVAAVDQILVEHRGLQGVGGRTPPGDYITILRQACRIQIDGTVKGDFCMGPLRIRQWCQSRSKVRFALHSDASTEAATTVAAEYFPVTVKITTDWLVRWSWHYKNSDAVNACRFTPPSKISVLFDLANSRQW